MPHRQECSDKTARELFLEQAAAYFDDLKTGQICTICNDYATKADCACRFCR